MHLSITFVHAGCFQARLSVGNVFDDLGLRPGHSGGHKVHAISGNAWRACTCAKELMLHSTKLCAHKLPFRPPPLKTVSCCRMISLGLPMFPWTSMLCVYGCAPRVWLAAEAPSCLEPTSPCESLASSLMAAAPPLSPALPLRAMAGAEPWWFPTLFCSAVCACSVAGELAIHALDVFKQSDRPGGPENAKAVIETAHRHMVLLQPQLAVHVQQNKT